MWKTQNILNYPIKIDNQVACNNTINTRAMTSNRPIEIGSSEKVSKSCIGDAIKIWNAAPLDLKKSKSLYVIKRKTRTYVKTLPA